MPRLVAERNDLVPVLAEIFRERGFDGANLSLICERTGLGKGSLYHFFPGGKEEMASAVLDEIGGWFQLNIFEPLWGDADPGQAVLSMLDAVDDYFRSGRRVCLLGAFALDATRDRFASAVRAYFVSWIDALASVLLRDGRDAETARSEAENTIAAIQGALVLARALDDPSVFSRMLSRLRAALTQH